MKLQQPDIRFDNMTLTAWLCCEPLAPVRLRADLQLKIGRSLDCDLTLPHRSVSRFHAQVMLLGKRLTVTDLSSSNGTYVNDERIKTCTEVYMNDRIKIGPYEAFIRETPTLMINTQADLLTASDHFTMVGQLGKTPLIEIFQTLEFNKKTGTLHIKAHLPGILVFREGRPIAAEIGQYKGVDAIMHMLDLNDGCFMLTETIETLSNSINTSFTSIMLDFMRKSDER